MKQNSNTLILAAALHRLPNVQPGRWKFTSLLVARLLVLGWTSGIAILNAQEPDGSDEAVKKEDVAWVRSWAVLGDARSADRYTLTYEPGRVKAGDPDKWFVFSSIRGCHRSGYSKGFFAIPAGKCKFSLVRDGDDPSRAVVVEEDFKQGAAYTLLSVIEGGAPVMRLIPEYPTPPEDDGIYIYNLIDESPLSVQVGEGSRLAVPYSVKAPAVVPVAKAAGETVTFIYQSKRKTEVRTNVAYDGKGRLSVVFMRNDSSRPTVFAYPSEPDKE